MLLMILGAGIGYIWGVVPACIGFLIGMMVNTIARDQAVAGVSHSDADNTQNLPIIDDFVDDDRPTDLFVADNGIYLLSSNDDDCSATFLHYETEYNPANGLAMSGGLDIEGNLAGSSDQHQYNQKVGRFN